MASGTKKLRKLRMDTYGIVRDAVERGCKFALMRARKHTDSPSDETMLFQLDNEIMLALSEVINFDRS